MPSATKQIQIKISTLTILKIAGILLFLYFCYLSRDILAILFIAFIFFSALNPLVNRLQKAHIPRPLGVIFLYLILFSVISLILILFTPIVIEQIHDLIISFPAYWQKFFSGITQLQQFSSRYGLENHLKHLLDFLQENLNQGLRGVFSTIISIFGGLFSFFIILIIAFYMIVEKNSLKDFLQEVLPLKYRRYFLSTLENVEVKLGAWARAQLVLSFAIFVLIFAALSIARVKYALVLALFAGMTELIPYLGPIIGAAPAVLLTFLSNPLKAILVAFIYFAVQQFENAVLVPQIMRRAVGINPVVSIVCLMAGFSIDGVFGAILAIPSVVVLSVIMHDVLAREEKKK